MLVFLLIYPILGSLVDDILTTHSKCKENHKHFHGETLGYVTP